MKRKAIITEDEAYCPTCQTLKPHRIVTYPHKVLYWCQLCTGATRTNPAHAIKQPPKETHHAHQH